MGEDEAYINYLKNKVKNNKIIGNDLIEIISDDLLIMKIHELAQREIAKVLNHEMNIILIDTDIVFISLSIVALRRYDGNFYSHLRDIVYVNLYEKYNQQRIDGIIREILGFYCNGSMENSRLINIVLKNAIVPNYYLSNFFTFVYDIYKINFERNINEENLYEDFEFIYDGLRESMNDDSDELNLNVTKKTYKLIKSTKELIKDIDGQENLINYSIKVLKIIDDYYWDKYNNYLENVYFKYGFDCWVNENQKKERLKREENEKGRTGNRWIPKFQLIDDNIFLIPPEHKIKSNYDYRQIRIEIYNGNNLIYINEHPVIKEIIGGYIISNGSTIELKDPINKITYRVLNKDQIIYDSAERLHRRFILFNDEGIEIHGNKKFEGNITVCHIGSIPKIDDYKKEERYALGNIYVNEESIIKIENEYVRFSDYLKPDVYGEIIEDVYLVNPDEKLPVYRNVSTLMFDSKLNPDEIGIKVDNKNKRLDTFEYKIVKSFELNHYTVKVGICTPMVHELKVFEIKTEKSLENCDFKFVIDREFNYKLIQIEKNTYFLNLRTGLNVKDKIYKINVKEYDKFRIIVDNKYDYSINLNIPIFKLENVYYSIDEYIWKDDVRSDSRLYFSGFKSDTVEIYDDNGVYLTQASTMKGENYYYVSLGFVKTYENNGIYTRISFKNNGKCVGFLDILNRCIIDEKLTKIIYDPDQNIVDLKMSYSGKGNIVVDMCDENNKILCSIENVNNNRIVRVRNPKSFKEYIFNIYEKVGNFMMSEKIKLHTIKRKFYYYNDLINNNKYFFISTAKIDNGDEENPVINLRRTFIELKKYLGKQIFVGSIYNYNGSKEYLNNINPVFVEFVKDIYEGNVEAYVTTEDKDGLLIDYYNKTILNKNFDKKAASIYTININIDGGR